MEYEDLINSESRQIKTRNNLSASRLGYFIFWLNKQSIH